MGSREPSEAESVCLPTFRLGTAELYWHAVCYGGDENRIVHHRQEFSFLPRARNSSSFVYYFIIVVKAHS